MRASSALGNFSMYNGADPGGYIWRHSGWLEGYVEKPVRISHLRPRNSGWLEGLPEYGGHATTLPYIT